MESVTDLSFKHLQFWALQPEAAVVVLLVVALQMVALLVVLVDLQVVLVDLQVVLGFL